MPISIRGTTRDTIASSGKLCAGDIPHRDHDVFTVDSAGANTRTCVPIRGDRHLKGSIDADQVSGWRQPDCGIN
jgi:hypothetical protein